MQDAGTNAPSGCRGCDLNRAIAVRTEDRIRHIISTLKRKIPVFRDRFLKLGVATHDAEIGTKGFPVLVRQTSYEAPVGSREYSKLGLVSQCACRELELGLARGSIALFITRKAQ